MTLFVPVRFLLRTKLAKGTSDEVAVPYPNSMMTFAWLSYVEYNAVWPVIFPTRVLPAVMSLSPPGLVVPTLTVPELVLLILFPLVPH